MSYELSLLILIIGVPFVCVYIGWKISKFHSDYISYKFLSDLEKHKQETDKNTIIVYIEKNDDSYFVYNKKTNEYITHAKTSEAIRNNLMERYPDMQILASEEDVNILSQK